MTRWLQIVSVATACIAALIVFQIKFQAGSVAERAEALQRQIDEEKEAISKLKAEWSFLIQPSRIQELAENFYARLQLQPLEAEQIGTVDLLPARRLEIEPESRAKLEELLISGEGLDDFIAASEGDQ